MSKLIFVFIYKNCISLLFWFCVIVFCDSDLRWSWVLGGFFIFLGGVLWCGECVPYLHCLLLTCFLVFLFPILHPNVLCDNVTCVWPDVHQHHLLSWGKENIIKHSKQTIQSCLKSSLQTLAPWWLCPWLVAGPCPSPWLVAGPCPPPGWKLDPVPGW